MEFQAVTKARFVMVCLTLYTKNSSILERNDSGAGLTQGSGSQQAQAHPAGSASLSPRTGASGAPAST